MARSIVVQPMKFHEYLLTNAHVIIFLTCMSFLYHPVFSVAKSSYSTKVTYGLYKQELDLPVYYRSFIPIIYEFNLPLWGNMDVTLRDWRGKCETDEFSPSYSCPVFFHFEKFIEKFKNDILPQNSSLQLQTIPSAPVTLPEDLCNSIHQHFPGLLTGKVDVETYLQSLKKCPFGETGVYKRSLKDYFYNIKEIYKTMNQKFEQEFSNRMTSTDRIGPAYYINALASHQNSLMFNYWVEKTRWNQAQISCNGKNIPNSVVRLANFSDDLLTIENQASLLNLIPSVSISEISIYYKLPIADCSFINNGNFLVRILVPVRKRNSKLKMYKVQPVPFMYSEGKEKKICQITMEPDKFLFDKMTGSVEKTTCNSRSLCHIKKNSETQIANMCINSFFDESLLGVKKHCNYDCITINEHGPQVPIFQRVSSDMYIITGNSNIGILVKCEDKKDQLLQHQDIGALEVRLPCNCYLSFHSESYHIQQPCSNQLTITQVMPVHFMKENIVDDNISVGDSINILDTNVLETDLEPNSERLHTPTSLDGSKSSSTTIMWVILILQTGIIFALIALGIYKYKMYRSDILYSKERLVYNISSISSPSIADNHRASSVEST